MKNILRNTALATVATAITTQSALASSFSLGGDSSVQGGLKGSNDGVDTAAQNLIGNFVTFLYLLAVVYALWGGFQILTAGGEEEKVTKGRTIIIQALIGLVVIFLANSIVVFLINSILGI